jgi:hypothetical protein
MELEEKSALLGEGESGQQGDHQRTDRTRSSEPGMGRALQVAPAWP